MKFLTDQFVENFDDFPSNMDPIGEFTYLRTYSRYLEDKGRRETWRESVRRAVEYNVGLEVDHLDSIGLSPDYRKVQQEAEELFVSHYNLNQALSGRTLWVGGAENGLAHKYPLANFNCSYLTVETWRDLGDLFYLLLVGTGVGFKCTRKMAEGLPPVKADFEAEHKPYTPLLPEGRFEHSQLFEWPDEGFVSLVIGDSKEGWVEALNLFMDFLTKDHYRSFNKIKLIYDSVRPKGERLKTFGGTASGPDPLLEMFQGFEQVIKNRVDPNLAPPEPADDDSRVKLRPIHILDMGNMIGNNVVVGGVRRTAEIFLFDPDDYECMWAKYGINGFWKEADFHRHERLMNYLYEHDIPHPAWMGNIGVRHYDENINIDFMTGEPNREEDGSLAPFNFGTGLHHRSMSNNSIAFIDKPSREELEFINLVIQTEGEPGFANLHEAARRRCNQLGISDPAIIRETAERIGLNPCAEIILDKYQVCNLTTLNAKAFVYQNEAGQHCLDVDGILRAQRLSARAGLRMTLVELELPHWNVVQQRDRLIGTSLTGWQDAMGLIGASESYEEKILDMLRSESRAAADTYAKELRIASPLLATTVKPEGTLSLVFGGVSSGLHRPHSEYHIRRIRINAADPLAKAVKEHDGWLVRAENGTPGETEAEKMNNARTYVINFPVFSGSRETKDDVTVRQQFDTYFRFQQNYTEHNSSITITVQPEEWDDVERIIWENWDNFVAVSFLSLDGGTYQQAPYEKISYPIFEEMKSRMTPFDMDLLNKYETAQDDSDLDTSACEGGACPIR